MRILYVIYQFLIAWPVLALCTMFTAITTILFQHWRNSWWLHDIQAWWSRMFFYMMFLPVTVSGREHIRPNQSYVFVSNHQSLFDVFAIYGWLPVVFKWLMKAELRKMPFVGSACKAAGHVFVDRRNTRAAAESLREVESVLRDGVCTVIFPEGTRSRTGELGSFKRGAFQIAMDLNLPVIPLTLTGCYEAMAVGDKTVRRHPIHMHIGEEIDLAQFNGDRDAAMAAVRQAIADELAARKHA